MMLTVIWFRSMAKSVEETSFAGPRILWVGWKTSSFLMMRKRMTTSLRSNFCRAAIFRRMKRGKLWGIANDLAALGEPVPDVGVFRARFDRIYNSSMLQPEAVIDFCSPTRVQTTASRRITFPYHSCILSRKIETRDTLRRCVVASPPWVNTKEHGRR